MGTPDLVTRHPARTLQSALEPRSTSPTHDSRNHLLYAILSRYSSPPPRLAQEFLVFFRCPYSITIHSNSLHLYFGCVPGVNPRHHVDITRHELSPMTAPSCAQTPRCDPLRARSRFQIGLRRAHFRLGYIKKNTLSPLRARTRDQPGNVHKRSDTHTVPTIPRWPHKTLVKARGTPTFCHAVFLASF